MFAFTTLSCTVLLRQHDIQYVYTQCHIEVVRVNRASPRLLHNCGDVEGKTTY
jgi:hypothetical protein